ncbi:MAG: ribosome assembly RNA-binding protein YhbY [Acidobacteriota bacterium]
MATEPHRRLDLTGGQRKFLRGQAHALKPVVHIGKQGLSESVLASLDQALEEHELIKVKFVDWKDEKAELTTTIETELSCACAGKIGHVVVLFRPARQPAHRKVRLPKGKPA